MKRVISIAILLTATMLLNAINRDPVVSRMIGYQYDNGWQQDRYIDFDYNDNGLVDVTSYFEGDVDAGVEYMRTVHSYNEEGDIILDMEYDIVTDSLEPVGKVEYEYCAEGLDLKTYYAWEDEAWEVITIWDNLWQDGILYRMDQTVYSIYGDMEMYDLYTYDEGHLVSKVSYSYIEYYGGWVQMSRTEYTYNEHGIFERDVYNVDLTSNTEYHSFHESNSYIDGLLSETIYSYAQGATNALELYRRYTYEYSNTPLEENVQPIVNVSVYPNPCKDSFKLTSDTRLDDVVLYDIKGRKIKDIEVNNAVDTTNLANGIYFLKSKQNKAIAKKVVVVK